MNSFYPKRVSKNLKIIWISFQVLIVLGGYYLFIYKSYGYKSLNDIIGGSMVGIGILMILMAFVNSPFKNKWYDSTSLRFYILATLLVLGVIYILTQKRNFYYEKQAQIPTLAKIIRKENSNYFWNRRSQVRIYATIQYFENGNEIIQRIPDYWDEYEVGNYVPIRYSKQEPELFRIDFEYKE